MEMLVDSNKVHAVLCPKLFPPFAQSRICDRHLKISRCSRESRTRRKTQTRKQLYYFQRTYRTRIKEPTTHLTAQRRHASTTTLRSACVRARRQTLLLFSSLRDDLEQRLSSLPFVIVVGVGVGVGVSVWRRRRCRRRRRVNFVTIVRGSDRCAYQTTFRHSFYTCNTNTNLGDRNAFSFVASPLFHLFLVSNKPGARRYYP